MITLDIVNNSGLGTNARFFLNGHGIPGNAPAGSPPQALNALGSKGYFGQVAVLLTQATCAKTTATITTAVPHSITVGQSVFVVGMSIAAYNGVFKVTAVSGNTFSYTVSATISGSGTGGAAYLASVISTLSIASASAQSGIVTVTLSAAATIPLSTSIFISNCPAAAASMNGVWEVIQNASTNPGLDNKQFQLSIPNAAGSIGSKDNVSLQAVLLSPVSVASLPKNKKTKNNCVIFDAGIAGFSSRLEAIVVPSGQAPTPFTFTPGTANLIGVEVPPFALGMQVPAGVIDIVEFYYKAGGYSTFDLSQVDGFALPLTLAAEVTSGPAAVGVNSALPGISRGAIGAAFNKFISLEPADVQTTGQFGRLLYSGALFGDPFKIAVPAPSANLKTVSLQPQQPNSAVILVTATGPHGLVPGQLIRVKGAVAPYSGTFKVLSTGLFDNTLGNNQFTYVAQSAPSSPTAGAIIPTMAGAVAVSATNLVANISGGQTPNQGSNIALSDSGTRLDGNYTVIPMPEASGLPSSSVFLVAVGRTLTIGAKATKGILGTPIFTQPPSLPNGQFYAIAAPKDWLANQPGNMANDDPMVSWWDTTINTFFAAGNYLQVATGPSTSYTGTYNETSNAFDFVAGLNGPLAFSIAKPQPIGGQSASAANASWVWGQAGISTTELGAVWDQIVMAFCRGVALDGVLKVPPVKTGQSNNAWVQISNWYTEHTSTAFPKQYSRYCPFAKFLHYADINGRSGPGVSKTTYLQQLAYGFSEDEVPVGEDGNGISVPVPSKMDGTIKDNSTMTLTLNPW